MPSVLRSKSLKKATLVTVGSLAVALLLAGCGSPTAATPAPTATTAATATPTTNPALSATFTSPDGLYSLGFPTTWAKTPINVGPIVNGIALYSPDSNDFLSIMPNNTGVPSSQYQAYYQESMKGLGAANVAYGQTGTVTLGTNNWTFIDATFTLNGTAYDGALYGLSHIGNAFFIAVGAPHADFSTVSSGQFQPVITSLTFLK
jgi:hypothetical protein